MKIYRARIGNMRKVYILKRGDILRLPNDIRLATGDIHERINQRFELFQDIQFLRLHPDCQKVLNNDRCSDFIKMI